MRKFRKEKFRSEAISTCRSENKLPRQTAIKAFVVWRARNKEGKKESELKAPAQIKNIVQRIFPRFGLRCPLRREKCFSGLALLIYETFITTTCPKTIFTRSASSINTSFAMRQTHSSAKITLPRSMSAACLVSPTTPLSTTQQAPTKCARSYVKYASSFFFSSCLDCHGKN